MMFFWRAVFAPNRVGGAEFSLRKKKKKWKTIDQNSVVQQMEIAKKLRIFSFTPSAIFSVSSNN